MNDLGISLIVPDWLKVLRMLDWLGTHRGMMEGLIYLVLCFDWLNVWCADKNFWLMSVIDLMLARSMVTYLPVIRLKVSEEDSEML